MRIRYAILALLLLCTPAHAQQTKAAMTTTIGNCFPTQSVGAITPATVVTCLTTLINSYQQYTTVRTVTGTTDTLATTDYGSLIRYSSASPITETLAQATGTFAPFNFFATNSGTATAFIVPGTSTIGGNATLPLAPGQSAFIVADGVNWDVWQTAQIATPSVFGLVEPDNVTIKTSNGVLTAIGAAGTSIGVGTTTVAGSVSGDCLTVGAGTTPTLANQACLTPGGTTGQVQYNTTPTLGGVSGVTSDGTNMLFGSGNLHIKGSSTGFTAIASGNTTANTFTWTVPAVTDTFAGVNSADQIVSGGANIVPLSIGIVSSGTTTIDCGKNAGQWMVNNGSFTLGAPAVDGMCVVEVIAGASAGTITASSFSPRGIQGAIYGVTPTNAATATFTNATATITWITNTLLSLNAPVYFTNSGGGLPTNFTAGTIYYVSALLSTNQIQVSATPTGAAIVAGSSGTGTQTGDQPTVFDLTVTRINGNTLGIWTQVQ